MPKHLHGQNPCIRAAELAWSGSENIRQTFPNGPGALADRLKAILKSHGEKGVIEYLSKCDRGEGP